MPLGTSDCNKSDMKGKENKGGNTKFNNEDQ